MDREIASSYATMDTHSIRTEKGLNEHNFAELESIIKLWDVWFEGGTFDQMFDLIVTEILEA